MTHDLELKPCPFCGGKAERIELTDDENVGGSVVQCTKCSASSAVHFDRKENLFDWWNRRAALSHEGEAKVQVKPLDLSNVIKHAFLSGVVAARNIPGHDECIGPDLWVDYDPTANPAYDRILSAIDASPAPKVEAVKPVEPVAWLLDWGFKKGPGVPFAGGGRSLHDNLEAVERHERKLSDYDGTEWIRRTPLYTSPVPAITDEAVERAAKAIHDGPLGANEEADFGDNESSDWCREVARAALLAAFPSRGEGR